jgi:hypothetical protein
MVNLLQILAQPRGRPHRRAIAQLAWIPLNHLQDQRINDPMHRARTASALFWRDASRHVQCAAPAEAGYPLVHRLARAPQAYGHLWHGLPLIEPQQSLGSTKDMGISSVSRESFQGCPLFGAECQQSHRFTSWLAGDAMTHSTCQRTF